MLNTLVMRLLNHDYAEFDAVSKVGALTLIGILAPGFQRHPGSKLSEAYGYHVLFDTYTSDNLIAFLGNHSPGQRDTADIMRVLFRFEEAAQRVPLSELTYILREQMTTATTDTTQQMLLICASEFTLQASLVQAERQAESHSHDHDEDEDLGPHHHQIDRPDRDPDLERMAKLAMQVQAEMPAQVFAPLPDSHWLRTGQLNVTHMQTGLPQVIDLNNPTDVTLNQNPQAILAQHLRNQINPDAPPFQDVDAFTTPLFQLLDLGSTMREIAEATTRMPSLEDVYPRDPQHWLYQPLPPFPPMGMRTGLGRNPSFRYQLNAALVDAVHYAIQIATRGGTELPLDVDRIVQNTMVGLFGFNTADGLPEGAVLDGIDVPPLFDYNVAQSMQPPLQPTAKTGDVQDPSTGQVESVVETPKKPRMRTSKTKAQDKGQTE